MATADSKNMGETKIVESQEEGASCIPKHQPTHKKRKQEDPDEEYYNFQHKQRGICLIFNQKKFDEDLNLSIRHGTDKDRDDCKELFDWLGFDVKPFDNLTEAQIMEEIDKAVDDDHSDRDCLAVIIMSHGDADMIYGYDAKFQADDLIDKFRGDNCTTLAGKPKFFFIQACRGGEMDTGVLVPATDSDAMSFKIPTTSDFLICWATYKGQKSWRHTTDGSWFLQSTVEILKEQALDDDLLSLMTKVNRYIIKNYPANENKNKQKQSATFISTLQKKVQFNQRT